MQPQIDEETMHNPYVRVSSFAAVVMLTTSDSAQLVRERTLNFVLAHLPVDFNSNSNVSHKVVSSDENFDLVFT